MLDCLTVGLNCSCNEGDGNGGGEPIVKKGGNAFFVAVGVVVRYYYVARLVGHTLGCDFPFSAKGAARPDGDNDYGEGF